MAPIPRVCPVCKNSFIPLTKYKEQIFCSNECYRSRGSKKLIRGSKKRVPPLGSPRVCPVCEISFIPPMKNKGKVYCSKECYRSRGRTNIKKPDYLYPSERIFKEGIEASVSQIFHSGFPDFLIEREGQLIFVEVKGKADVLRKNQIDVMNLLSAHGLECFISYERSLDLIPFNKIKPIIEKFKFMKVSSIISRL